jgi:hypothetical protein
MNLKPGVYGSAEKSSSSNMPTSGPLHMLLDPDALPSPLPHPGGWDYKSFSHKGSGHTSVLTSVWTVYHAYCSSPMTASATLSLPISIPGTDQA